MLGMGVRCALETDVRCLQAPFTYALLPISVVETERVMWSRDCDLKRLRSSDEGKGKRSSLSPCQKTLIFIKQQHYE